MYPICESSKSCDLSYFTLQNIESLTTLVWFHLSRTGMLLSLSFLWLLGHKILVVIIHWQNNYVSHGDNFLTFVFEMSLGHSGCRIERFLAIW